MSLAGTQNPFEEYMSDSDEEDQVGFEKKNVRLTLKY